MDEPDSADTPERQRRSAGQRRADALGRARLALDKGLLPTVQGVRPHLLLFADLADLVTNRSSSPTVGADGRVDLTDLLAAAGATSATSEPSAAAGDDPAGGRAAEAGSRDPAAPAHGFAPRLRWTGRLSPERLCQLARQAKVTAVLTMGPWRVTSMGRTMRVLPAWLRGALEGVHRTCRGPDCDRPAVWAQAHHEQAWADGGQTDLNRSIPLCKVHHDLVTDGQWHATFDPDSGVCTWTSRAGRVRTVRPPPR